MRSGSLKWRVFVAVALAVSCLGCGPVAAHPHKQPALHQAPTECRAPNSSRDCKSSEVLSEVDAGPRIPATPLHWASLPNSEQELHRIAFGSCSNQYSEQPIWGAIERGEPDLFLHLGDLIYADKLPWGERAVPADLDVVEKARVDYAFLRVHPSFGPFATHIPFMSVWDDHDYGKNDAGASFPHAARMKELYLEFVGASSQDERRAHRGVYWARSFGPEGKRTQILLLDTRTFRDDLLLDPRSAEERKVARVLGKYAPHQDETKTLLGEEQWQWLEARLSEPADLRIVGSSIQVLADEKGTETWGNFPHERARLVRLLKARRASGALLLSGDVHFGELSRSLEGPYPLYDFTSSNLAERETAWGEASVNRYRLAGPYSKLNFGRVDIDWDERSVELSLRNQEGASVFASKISIGELRVP